MKFSYKNLTLEIPKEVYYPREDSLLMAECIESIKPEGKCLDMGTGSGFLAILMARLGAEVIAADIDENAVKAATKNAQLNGIRIKAALSDLFEHVEGTYDFISFNPPYIPVHNESWQWAGGETGRTVIEKFLSQAGKHLKKNGSALILISSITGEKEVLKMFEQNRLKPAVLKREKIPWEELIAISGHSPAMRI